MSNISEPDYKQYRYRWLNLSVYLLAALVNSIPAQAFSSINSKVEQSFHLTAFQVTINTLLFPILHPIAAFPVSYVLDNVGMRFGCAIGGLILLAGVWLRIFIEYQQPWICIGGSMLAAFGNIFILNSPSKLASQWFRPQVVPAVISIAVLASNISITLGASVPGLVIKQSATAQDIRNFFMLQAIIISAPILLMVIFLREKPAKPPSPQQNHGNIKEKQSYIQTLKQMFSNKQYIKIMLAMSFSYGTMIAVLATLDQTLSSLGYNEPGRITSLVILPAMLIGIISTVIISVILKKARAYKKFALFLLVGAFITLGGLFVLLIVDRNPQTELIIIGVSAVAGIFLVPQSSVLIGFASQAVYPLGQASASGYQYAASQTFGFILGVGIIVFLGKGQQNEWRVYTVFGVQAVLFLLGGFFILLTKQQLKRRDEGENIRNSFTDRLKESLIVGGIVPQSNQVQRDDSRRSHNVSEDYQ